MVVEQVERIMARRQINALILADPIDIILTRRAKVPVPGGGWRFGPPAPLDPQQVTIIPFKRRMSDALVGTELGEVVDLPYVVVGRHDLDIQRGDIFIYNGDKFEVKNVDLKTEVRTAAHVDYYGEVTS